MESAAIVLAASAGTRMKSRKPKVAHEVLGKPMVRCVVDAAREAGLSRIVTVVGHERDQVIPLVEADTQIAEQYVRRGTADAVNSCREQLGDFDGSVVVLSGDCPLITPSTIRKLVDKGFVRRTRDESDRRKVMVALTKKGRLVYRAHGLFHKQMIDEALSGLSEEEERVLTEALVKVKAFFDERA